MGEKMSKSRIPPEMRCWEISLDAVGWQTDENWWRKLSLGRFDSLVQMRHRSLPLVIDLDWFDPDAADGRAGVSSPSGKFRLRVLQSDDWENPIDGYHITNSAELDGALRRMIKRYG